MVRMFCTLRQAADKLKTTETEVEAMVNKGVLREFRDGSTRLVKMTDLTALTASVAGSQRSPRVNRVAAGSVKKKEQAGSAGRARVLAASGRAASGGRTRAAAISRHEQTPTPPPRKARVPARASAGADTAEIKLPPSAAAAIRRDVHSRPHNSPQTAFTADSPKLEQCFDSPDADSVERLDVYHTIASERRPVPAAHRPAPSVPRPSALRMHPTPVFRARQPKPQTHELSLGDWIWTGLIDDRPHTILVLLGMVLVGAATIAGIGYLLTQVL